MKLLVSIAILLSSQFALAQAVSGTYPNAAVTSYNCSPRRLEQNHGLCTIQIQVGETLLNLSATQTLTAQYVNNYGPDTSRLTKDHLTVVVEAGNILSITDIDGNVIR